MNNVHPTLRALQAIVFDFDGVLGNTEPLHLKVFQQVFADYGIPLSDAEYYERYLGFDDVGVCRAVSNDRGFSWTSVEIDRIVDEKAARFKTAATSEPCLFPGVVESLRAWRTAVPMAIASGALRHEIQLILAGGGLADAVATIVAAGETANGKPAPDPFARAVELLSASGMPVRPERTVAIEDSVWGIESARAAGLKVLAITTSYPAERLTGADAVVASFADITLEMLDELAAREMA
jgi:beta-phosphoglucomutase